MLGLQFACSSNSSYWLIMFHWQGYIFLYPFWGWLVLLFWFYEYCTTNTFILLSSKSSWIYFSRVELLGCKLQLAFQEFTWVQCMKDSSLFIPLVILFFFWFVLFEIFLKLKLLCWLQNSITNLFFLLQ